MSRPGHMLFGRRTWPDFITAWAHSTDGNPFTAHLNATTKYVAARTLTDAGAWANSVLLRDNAGDTVANLKTQPGPDLSIIGSASLVGAPQSAGLIDEYTFLIHPLILDSGQRLFDQSAPLTKSELTRSVATTKGVLIAGAERDAPVLAADPVGTETNAVRPLPLLTPFSTNPSTARTR